MPLSYHLPYTTLFRSHLQGFGLCTGPRRRRALRVGFRNGRPMRWWFGSFERLLGWTAPNRAVDRRPAWLGLGCFGAPFAVVRWLRGNCRGENRVFRRQRGRSGFLGSFYAALRRVSLLPRNPMPRSRGWPLGRHAKGLRRPVREGTEQRARRTGRA